MGYTRGAMQGRVHAFAVVVGLSGGGCLGPDPTTPLTVFAPTLGEHELALNVADDPVAERAFAVEAEPTCAPVDTLAILFIGNSYVIQSDTPGLLQAMADDAGVDFYVERLATGGKDFEYHLGRSKTRQTLAQREWDVVFLQSHSLDPLRNPEGFSLAGGELIDAVRSAGAQPWLFETWARRAGHNLYNYMKEVGNDPDVMQGRVSARYAALGEAHDVPVARVGTAWMRLLESHPEVRPYLNDGAHPAEAGAYLSAAVVFTHLTERDPRDVLQPHGAVDRPTARALAEVAAEVVDPPCEW